MEKRRTSRIKHRLTCELIVDRQSYPAVVRDLAPTGSLRPDPPASVPNSVIEVRFPATAGLPAFSIEAGVARHRNVHPRLQAEVQSGVGLEILGRPPDYLALATRVVAPKSAIEDAAQAREAASAGPRPRGSGAPQLPRPPRGPRPQPSPHPHGPGDRAWPAARARALTQAGAGWKITEVEAI